MTETPDLGAATGDAMAVLRLLADDKVEHPTDITEEIGSVNHRYARELLGLLVTQGLAEQVDGEEGGEWVTRWHATESGSILARQTAAWLNGSSTETTGHSPKEHKMPNKTKTASKAKATATKTPKTLKDCGCGCGTQVKGQFAQGHDARMVSQEVAKITAPSQVQAVRNSIAKSFSEHLAAKFETAAHNRIAKANAPKRERKAAAPRKSTSKPKTVEAKVGRWTKTGHLTAEGDLVTTNAKGQEQVIAKGKFQLVK